MSAWLGITMGDPTGIGPEVTLKALAALGPDHPTKFLLIGDRGFYADLDKKLGTRLPLRDWNGPQTPGSLAVCQANATPLPLGLPCGDAAAAKAAVDALHRGAELSMRGDIAGIVTAPVNKEAIARTGLKFIGQTELLSDLGGTSRTAMMLLGEDDRGRWLRVALVTTHLAIKNVAAAITPEKVALAIELAADSCRKLNLPRARIGVCGLNPHAGEGGEFGDEEIRIITPTVAKLRNAGLNVDGPHPADTLFYYAYRGDYDAVVAMYHDQGLAPLKMIGFEKGINWTLGLPFVRTSPDHGTAYNIAGLGVANPSSMLSAIRLAEQLIAGKN